MVDHAEVALVTHATPPLHRSTAEASLQWLPALCGHTRPSASTALAAVSEQLPGSGDWYPPREAHPLGALLVSLEVHLHAAAAAALESAARLKSLEKPLLVQVQTSPAWQQLSSVH